jgi:hypothetical protein
MRLLAIILCFIYWLCPLYAQVEQPRNNFSNGVLTGSAGSLVATGIVGQSVIGPSQNGNLANFAGYFVPFPGDGACQAQITTRADQLPSVYVQGQDLVITIEANDALCVQEIKLLFTGLTTGLSSTDITSLTTQDMVRASGNTFSTTLSSSQLGDPIGILYLFEILSTDGSLVNTSSTLVKIALATFNAQSGTAPEITGISSFGTSVNNYQIVSVPYVLPNNSVTAVFDEISPTYDQSAYRIFSYRNTGPTSGNYVEFQESGFPGINPGIGYWLIIAEDPGPIDPGAGSVVEVSPDNPYELVLQPGLNLIGNPFPTAIDWSAIKSVNGNPEGISDIQQFLGGTYNTNQRVAAFRGGFVRNDNADPFTISIPVSSEVLGGRKSETNRRYNSIDEREWEIAFHLSDGVIQTEIPGIGMRMDAREGLDQYDFTQVPGVFESADLIFDSELSINRHIVPSAESYIWTFEVVNARQSTVLSWDHAYFKRSQKELWIYDPRTNQKWDMKAHQSILLDENSNRFKVIYGSSSFVEEEAVPEITGIFNPYPNPFRNNITIPFVIEEAAKVDLRLYDISGTLQKIIYSGNKQEGYHEFSWNAFDDLKSGLYTIYLIVETPAGIKRYNSLVIRQ